MRNVAVTKAKILNAARVILERDGFEGLGLNKVAAEAGVGKPLIYRYFGGVAGLKSSLAQEAQASFFIESQDVANKHASEIIEDLLLGGRALAGDRLTRDMLLWSLSPSGDEINIFEDEQPESDNLAAVDGDKRATYAILKAAIAFVVLYRDGHKTWAGLPLTTHKDMAHLERALAEIVKRSWDKN